MINLLPDETKKEIRAARVSVILVRYVAVVILAFVFLVLLLAGSYFVLTQTKNSATQLIDANSTKAEVYSSTKAQVDALSSSLAETKSILDQEVLYSNVLMNIGQQMPPGTVIDKIALDASSFTGTPLTLKAYAKTTNAAVALREKFQSSPIFTNVSFQSISDTSGGISGYPVSVSMTLTISKAATK
ncbi:MAG: Fimbrial assembly family protein [Candidatus Saccharibacteria bacterium]|nr:Fimbrial assembly family protein [Candidatus Saccharibacteria bacterium]